MASPTPNPVVLLVNCLDWVSSADSLVHPINLLKDFPDLTPLGGKNSVFNSQNWDWAIDNKYYTAKIEVVVIPSPLLTATSNPLLDPENGLADRVEAVVLCCGGGKKLSNASFNLVKHWTPFVDRFSPPVRLAVCEGFEDDGEEGGSVSFSDAIGWCIENQFELVQFDGEDEEDDGEEDDVESTSLKKPFASGEFGVPRILAALHAHMWSNLTMKDTKGAEEQRSEASGERVANETRTKTKTKMEANLESMLGNIELNGDGAVEEENFEQLFNKMAQLKSHSQSMQIEDRKAFAEEVTMAFWRAIGGDEDELDGLDDDDDDVL